MSIVLAGKPLVDTMVDDILTQKQTLRWDSDRYLAIIFVWDDSASTAYVRLKQKMGQRTQIPVEVFGQDTQTWFADLQEWKQKNFSSLDTILDTINFCNDDDRCVGILVQLPLPEHLWEHVNIIMQSIRPSKDVDALAGTVYGMDALGIVDFLGATPQAAMTLLEHYGLKDMAGKTVSVLWQSNLTGKPLATHCMKLGATVYSFNKDSDQDQMKQLCQQSDYIFSCTGQVHLVDKSFINPDRKHVVVDIGYGYKDGKPVWDVDIEQIKDVVYAYTPVPGGVWPLTVVSIFANIIKLSKYFS